MTGQRHHHHHHHHPAVPHFWGKVILSGAAGVIFGFAFERSGAYLPQSIIDMLSAGGIVTLKFFIGAVGASTGIIALSSLLPWTKDKYAPRKAAIVHRGMPAALLGGSLLGLGMRIGGVGPGTMWMHFGLRSSIALSAGLGATAAIFAFSILNDYLQPLVTSGKTKMSTLADTIEMNYSAIGLAFSAMCIAGATALEIMFPQAGVVIPQTGGPLLLRLLQMRHWPPALSGIIVGCMQAPLMLLVGTVHGSSTALVTLIGHALNRVAPSLLSRLHYLQQYRAQNNAWQVATMAGAALGAVASVYLAGPAAVTAAAAPLAISSARVFAGTFLVTFGARLAGGCTCGHGISGMSFTSTTSLATMGAAFATGLASSALMHAAGV